MNNRSQYLLKLAKQNAKAYIAIPKAKAAMVGGSVAGGICDEYSDLDSHTISSTYHGNYGRAKKEARTRHLRVVNR